MTKPSGLTCVNILGGHDNIMGALELGLLAVRKKEGAA